MFQLRIKHIYSFSDSRQRRAHAPCALIGLKRHAEKLLELPPGSGRVNPQFDQVAFAHALGRVFLNLPAQFFHKRWHRAGVMHGFASQARAKTGMQRFRLAREELDILAKWFSGRTDRPAEYPGRFHAEKKYPLVGRIPALQSMPEFIFAVGKPLLSHGVDCMRRFAGLLPIFRQQFFPCD